MSNNTPKTYVLIGYNEEDDESAAIWDKVQAGPLRKISTVYKNRGNCEILSFNDPRYATYKDAIASITSPANVILQSHGGKDGRFSWTLKEYLEEDPSPSYADFFRQLPSSGIASVMLGNCYGGTAETEEALASCPPGTLVFSMTGTKTLNSGAVAAKFAEETKGLTDPVDIFLKALDNFNPQAYRKDRESEYKSRLEGSEFIRKLAAVTIFDVDSDPDHALPHIIGIGGQPPQLINLQTECRALNGKATDPAFLRAIARVQTRFDTDYIPNFVYFDEKGKHMEGGGGGPEAERALDVHIAAVAHKLATGWIPADEEARGTPLTDEEVEEKRIAYAITTAWLKESGELEQRIGTAKRLADAQPRFDAYGTLIATPDPRVISQSDLVTPEEQYYLNSVSLKLGCAHHPELNHIVDRLRIALSAAPNNDTIPKDGQIDQDLRAHGVSTKGWVR
jgi:hypothetical protein